VSQSAALYDRTSSVFEFLRLSTRMWPIWLWVFPSGDVRVYLWMLCCGNIVLLTLRFLDVTKFTTLIPLSLVIPCKLSFPIVGLKMSCLPTLVLKSPNRIFVWNLGNLSITRSFTSSVLSSVGAWIFRTIIWHQGPLSIIYYIPSLTNWTLWTADMVLSSTKKKKCVFSSRFIATTHPSDFVHSR
jgi:hypothetical protein